MKRGRSSNPGRAIAAIARAERRAEALAAAWAAEGRRFTADDLMRAERKWLFRGDAERIAANYQEA